MQSPEQEKQTAIVMLHAKRPTPPPINCHHLPPSNPSLPSVKSLFTSLPLGFLAACKAQENTETVQAEEIPKKISHAQHVSMQSLQSPSNHGLVMTTMKTMTITMMMTVFNFSSTFTSSQR